MSRTSRLLRRNRVALPQPPYYALTVHDIPCTDPCDPAWQWPVWVRTPYLYGIYVRQLHRGRKLDMRFPEAVFRRFATKHSRVGYERLTRAAAQAAYVSKHPFSPKFIKKFLMEVPSQEVIVQHIF